MNMRPPSLPLITVDPFFSVWSPNEVLNETTTVHWTGKPNTFIGIAEIDGVDYRFMGMCPTQPMKQTSYDANAFSTIFTFEAAGVKLTAKFTSPLLMDDLSIMTRPVSYLKITAKAIDGKEHTVKAKISVSEEICMDYRGVDSAVTEVLDIDGIKSVKIGGTKQDVMYRSGDDVRIEWGYFYLSSKGENACVSVMERTLPFIEKMPHGDSETMKFVTVENTVCCNCDCGAVFTFAYDDIKSMIYFEKQLPSYWNKDGKTITEAIKEAHADYCCTIDKCEAFADRMFIDSVRAGGEKYAEMLELAYRQAIAAHKIAITEDGEILFVSKECFSNGCAATVDVSYPSIPLFLLYNPELVCGMMRPVYKYARSDKWPFDFAPHDVGQYPLLNGQVYSGTSIENQMPVEECGNMLVMAANVCIATGCTKFAEDNLDLLETWVKYLEKHGDDPEHQLCTDDFAGHLAHNCNLSLKAIMGIAGLGIIYNMMDKDGSALIEKAKVMAKSWAERAANGDGSYRLAFDREGTFSMKYNIVWDKLWGTKIMAPEVIQSEFASYRKHIHKYGMPLDNRQPYTKSDWLVWTATLANEKVDFIDYITPLWDNYNSSNSRVPMTDWYFTITSRQVGFQNRTVQGGLYIKLLEYKGTMRIQ